MKGFQLLNRTTIIVAALGLSFPVVAQTTDAPHGTATFASYADIDKVKELKT